MPYPVDPIMPGIGLLYDVIGLPHGVISTVVFTLMIVVLLRTIVVRIRPKRDKKGK